MKLIQALSPQENQVNAIPYLAHHIAGMRLKTERVILTWGGGGRRAQTRDFTRFGNL